jgi:hypothetical protein
MLLISRGQRQKAGDPAFVARVVQHLELYHFEEFCRIPEKVLTKRVAHCLERARAHGMTFEQTLTIFTTNMMRVNPEFDRQPDIARLLADTSRGEFERLKALISEVPEEAWDEAEQQGDPEAYWREVDAMPEED